MRRLAHAAAAASVLHALAAGCGGGLTSARPTQEPPPNAPPLPNGVVVSLGPGAWQEASQQLTVDLARELSRGLIFDGEVVASDAFTGLAVGGGVVTLGWEAAVMELGAIDLVVGPLGLAVDVAVELLPVTLSVEIGGQTSCTAVVSIPEGFMRGGLSLTKTKTGKVQASPVGHAALEPLGMAVELSDCVEPLAIALGTGETDALNAVTAHLAEAAFATLIPTLATLVPAALGVDIATSVSVAFGDDGVGAGQLDAFVRVPQTGRPQWWQYASERLVVPYTVGIWSAQPHACAAPFVAQPNASLPVPAIDADVAVLVHGGLVQRALTALWRSGGVCLDRATRHASWTAEELTPVWPALAHLAPGSRIRARLWPEEGPAISFSTGPGGRAIATVDTGLWSVELLGELDGAWVRLATVRTDLEVDAGVEVDEDGAVWLSPEDVTVAASGTSAGLLSAPPAAIAQALAAELAVGVLDAGPVWMLPAPLLRGARAAEWVAGYVVFSDGRSGPDSDGRLD